MPETTAMAPPLADPDELARWLPLAADDPRLTDLLTKASDRFRGAVHWPVHLVTDDDVWLDGDGSRSLLLPSPHVLDVASVQCDGRDLTVGADVQWSEAGVLRRSSGCWPDRLRSVQVVYTHGFDPVPGEIQDVVIEQARLAFSVTPGLSSMQVGGESLSFDTGGQRGANNTGTTGQWATVVEAYLVNRGDRA